MDFNVLIDKMIAPKREIETDGNINLALLQVIQACQQKPSSRFS